MTRAVILAAWLGALISANAASALPGYSINPSGTDALVNGALIVRADGLDTRACLNISVFAADPPSRADGDVWIVHNLAEHRLCFQAAGVTHCMTATAAP